MNTAFVSDVTAATFQKDVLDASKEVPVVVDFWAPWCGPCRSLGPILEKLAGEYGGRFRLAKVNSDQEMDLSQSFGIRSIPDVRAFRNGEIVDGFMGALPESQVRAFIDRVVPAPAEIERLRAAQLRAQHDLAGATAALRKAVDLDPKHFLARVDLAECLVQAAQYDQAAAQLDAVPEDTDWNARVAALRQAIAYAAKGGNEKEAAAKVEQNPADLEARLALAGALAARHNWRGAMDQLLEIVRRDKGWRDGEARKQMIAIFNLAAEDAELVSEYRRRLGSALN